MVRTVLKRLINEFPDKNSLILASSALIVYTQWSKTTLWRRFHKIMQLSFIAMQTLIFSNLYHNLEISLVVYYCCLVQKLKNLERQKILILVKSNTISQTHWLHCAPPLSWSLLSGAGVQHKLTSFCLVGKRGFHSKLEKARYQREQGKLLTLNDFLFRKHIAYFSLFI